MDNANEMFNNIAAFGNAPIANPRKRRCLLSNIFTVVFVSF